VADRSAPARVRYSAGPPGGHGDPDDPYGDRRTDIGTEIGAGQRRSIATRIGPPARSDKREGGHGRRDVSENVTDGEPVPPGEVRVTWTVPAPASAPR